MTISSAIIQNYNGIERRNLQPIPEVTAIAMLSCNHMIKTQVLGSPPAWEFQLPHLSTCPTLYILLVLCCLHFAALADLCQLLVSAADKACFSCRGEKEPPKLRCTQKVSLCCTPGWALTPKTQRNKKHPQSHSTKKKKKKTLHTVSPATEKHC